MKRYKIALIIAGCSTALSIVGMITGFAGAETVGEIMILLGVVLSIVSYCFGGFLTALKGAFKIAKIGWIAVPFPFDIFTFIFMFFLSIMILLFVPIVPVVDAYKQRIQ